MAGGGDLDFSAGGKIGGGDEESIGRDGADLRRAAGDAVDAPGDGSVWSIGDRGGKRERVAEEN